SSVRLCSCVSRLANSLLLILHCPRDIPTLHSFPTRRSSDLIAASSVAPRTRRLARVIAEELRDGSIVADCLRWKRNLGSASEEGDRKSTRLNSSHVAISYAVFCLKKKNPTQYL